MRALLCLSVMVIGLAALCTGAVGAPRGSYVVHEKRDSVPSIWTDLGRVAEDSNLTVRIGLKQSNLDNAHNYLRDISHPESPNYGRHWTSKQVIQTFAPSQKTVDNVKGWLIGAGIDAPRIAQSDTKHWLGFAAPAGQVERILQTKYYRYQDKSSGKEIVACQQYHLPGPIQKDVDYIVPGVIMKSPPASNRGKRAARGSAAPEARGSLPQRDSGHRPRKGVFRDNRRSSLEHCSKVITPECITALYEVPPPPKTIHPNNSLGIYEEGNFYTQVDLDSYFSKYSPWIPNGTHPILNLIDGASGPKSPGPGYNSIESNLDLQLAYPLVYPQTLTLYQTNDDSSEENSKASSGLFNTFLDAIDGSYCQYCEYGECGNNPDYDPVYPDPDPNSGYNGTLMCGVFEPTKVISVSYGGYEAHYSAAYQRRQCDEMLKLGLQGVTILFASGDSGVASDIGDKEANGCLGPKENIFNPAYPNNCPWLTNVGSTYIPSNHSIADPQPEVATERFGSGGGFSNIYSIPSYQASAVSKYFKNHNPPHPYYISIGNDSFGANGGVYNRVGRGYPDVAALGDNIAIYANARLEAPVYGTSASTPIFAALINRINEERLSKNKGPVGFINEVLYTHPFVLNDVVAGSNTGCREGEKYNEGFKAVPGWDPVTGLGTPNYPKMLDLFMSLP